jgi:hypothetical protein|tara:strand:- start:24 stop:488 length:465 start_codon:yes stop_codon:yes gene_type:complete
LKNNNRNKFKQGVYKPVNIEKYIGKKLPIFRSGWELKFFKWADCNENILKWGSENVIIPYLSPLDNKVHRYFVDNFIIFKDRNGNNNKFLIEIKPSKQTKRPVRSKKKKSSTMLYEQKTYVVNVAKWKAAKQWADKKGYKFLIVTEKELNCGWK